VNGQGGGEASHERPPELHARTHEQARLSVVLREVHGQTPEPDQEREPRQVMLCFYRLSLGVTTTLSPRADRERKHTRRREQKNNCSNKVHPCSLYLSFKLSKDTFGNVEFLIFSKVFKHVFLRGFMVKFNPVSGHIVKNRLLFHNMP